MTFSPNSLLQQLDHAEIIDWALELKYGKEAYAFLMQSIRYGQLNTNQMRNALHALFRIQHHGDRAAILQVFVELANHGNILVRSEAVQLAIGLIRFSSKVDKTPLILLETQVKSLREAAARGLSQKVTQLTAQFFA